MATTRGTRENIEARVRALAEPVVQREGYELLDVEFTSDRGLMILRLFIDTVPPGTKSKGITVDDCSVVSRTVGDLLEVEGAVPGEYHLEVSSPGLFRPLTKPAHFQRVVGERVKIRTFQKLGDRKVFTGILRRHEEGTLTVEVDGKEYRVPLEAVAKANLEPLLGA